MLKRDEAAQLIAAVHAGRKPGRYFTRDPKARAGARDWILMPLLGDREHESRLCRVEVPCNERDRRGTLAARQLVVLMRVDGGY